MISGHDDKPSWLISSCSAPSFDTRRSQRSAVDTDEIHGFVQPLRDLKDESLVNALSLSLLVAAEELARFFYPKSTSLLGIIMIMTPD